ncbi:hypothetical protein PRIPAC_97792 [Pristionchus pacificus]|uniref:Uncharacterized protein n=1 Tax=Pristionchus pacificus TaxID=54126 RepID=A0A2A6CU02_PRIPA|nr:hypothetical protein PRIPAC_97792 [Pristionchus pacificus]|eukprot:PDM81566.1 hypothetical protein PRIPAC_30547 [Pristionchus pacificus]
MFSQLVFFAGLCFTANAFVNYGDSALYDEYDLSLYKSFPLAECLAASCKVYVSAPESSLPALEKVFLGDTTLAALARESNATSGLKTPYNLKAYSGKNFITNLNFKFATAPVAVYIVYQRAAFYSTALVYEPSSAPLSVQWSNSSTLTLLSATNFTVTGAVKQGSLARGRVLAGGYDVATKSFVKTPALYEFSIDKSFGFSVYGPLATLYSSQSIEAELTIQNGVQESTFSRTFFTSAGYTGAISGQIYRSSLYSKTVQYKISYEKTTKVHFKAYLNTFADSVEVSVDGETTSLRGTLGLASYLQRFSASGKDIVITFAKSSDYSTFLLHVASEIVLDHVKEKIGEKVEEIKEKVAEKIADKIAEAKEALKEKVEEIKDKLKEKIQEKVDEKVDEAKEALQEKVEKEVEEKKEEIESKIEDVAEKLKDALSKATAKPDSAEVDEIKDALKEKIGEQVEEKAEEVEEKIEETQEKIEEAKEEVQDKIDDLRNKVTVLPDSSEIKEALKKKLEDRIGKVTRRPN